MSLTQRTSHRTPTIGGHLISRFKLASLALFALVALTAIIASPASALVLPLTEPRQATFTGKGIGKTLFTALGAATECATATAEGTEEKEKSLGSIHIHFLGCKTGTAACNSKGDEKEQILELILWHLVYDQFSKTVNDTEANLGVAILFLLGLGGQPDVILKCAAGTVKVEELGLALCLIKEYKTAALSHTFKCESNGEKAVEKTWFNKEDKEPNNAEATHLCSVNKAAEEECTLAWEGTIETKEKTKIAG